MRVATLLIALLLTPFPAAAQTTASPAPQSAPQSTSQSAARPEPVPVYGFEVVRTYPHDRRAFTQGLAFRDGELLESNALSLILTSSAAMARSKFCAIAFASSASKEGSS